MERRKILLGSGAALATVLAGCASETDEESPEDDDIADDDDDGFDGNESGDDDNGDDGDGDDDDAEDVPGVEGADELGTEYLSVEEVEHNPDTLSVLVETDTTDTEKLHKELEYLAEDLAHSITDPDAFIEEVEDIELVLEHEGSRVFAVYIDVDWLLEFLDDYITKEELAAKILETKQ